MTNLDRIINQFISGESGYWYFDFMLGDKHIGGGYFHSRADARRMLKSDLRKLVTDDSILYEYLLLYLKDLKS